MAMDLDKLQQLVSLVYLPAISNAFGSLGVQNALKMTAFLKTLYSFLAPERITNSLVVLESMNDQQNLLDRLGKPDKRIPIKFIAQEYPVLLSGKPLIIQNVDNEVEIWFKNIDLVELSADYIVYVYLQGKEFFVVKGDKKFVINPDPVYLSVFAIPTFSALEDALEEYAHHKIRTSGCKIFASAWYGGETSERLFFRSKPEHFMRDSLTQHLKTVLKNVDVRPEQNVDESHPVDIKVTWMFAYRIALIEIKWIGRSLGDNGKILPYSDKRANEGAKQLAEYLDWNKTQAPVHLTVGYLVIIDARRRGLKPNSKTIDDKDGNFFRDKEIKFDPDYHSLRSDFEKPIRMFAEPICR